MPEIWFYHLQNQPIEKIVPPLLERSLHRNWHGIIQLKDEDQLNMWDDFLWTYSESSFLAHGSEREGDADLQPIWLTLGNDNPNHAKIRFLVEGIDPRPYVKEAQYERIVYIFEGRTPQSLAFSREIWKDLQAQNLPLSYWQWDKDGRWVKKS